MAVNDWGARAVDTTTALQGGTALASGTTVDGQQVSNDTKDGTLVEVTIAVGGTALATGPAEVYICQEVGASGTYEDHNTAQGYTVPGQTASTTFRRAFFVPGSVPVFRVRIRNPNGGTQPFTPTVHYKQAATT